LFDGPRNTNNDPGEDEKADPVAYSPLCDLLPNPHNKHRAGHHGQGGDHNEPKTAPIEHQSRLPL